MGYSPRGMRGRDPFTVTSAPHSRCFRSYRFFVDKNPTFLRFLKQLQQKKKHDEIWGFPSRNNPLLVLFFFIDVGFLRRHFSSIFEKTTWHLFDVFDSTVFPSRKTPLFVDQKMLQSMTPS